MDIWTSVENGRNAFADYLASLAPEDWQRASLCAGWTVTDVVAHMLVVPTMSKAKVFASFSSSGFNLDKMNAKLVTKLTAQLSPNEILAKTRASASSRSLPPGLKLPGAYNELVVHAADVSEAVGAQFDLPTADYVASLDHLKESQAVFGAKKRIAGLKLQANDTVWTTGTGPVVEGSAKQLVLAMAGRRSALDALTGDGLATLRSRQSA